MKRLLFLTAILLSLNAQAATPVRALLPIYLDQPAPGAFNSLWASDFTMFNAGANTYVIKTCSAAEGQGCVLDLRFDEELLPNETQTGLPQRFPKPATSAPGAVVYLEPLGVVTDDASAISFQLRVRDLSRNAQSAGIEVPVVREAAFRTSTTRLLGVPTDPRFRLLLRVYDMNLDVANFSVRLFDEGTGARLSERSVTATTGTAQTEFRFKPAYAQVSELFAGIASPLPQRLRVEIEPLSPGTAFWAFVSVTNNDTQEFTLITPQ